MAEQSVIFPAAEFQLCGAATIFGVIATNDNKPRLTITAGFVNSRYLIDLVFSDEVVGCRQGFKRGQLQRIMTLINRFQRRPQDLPFSVRLPLAPLVLLPLALTSQA